MKLISLLSALALAVVPCQAEQPHKFNLTFHSVELNRDVQLEVTPKMTISMVRIHVARKLEQRLPLTKMQYHDSYLYDVKTVMWYGLNERSDPIIVTKRESKTHMKERLKKEKEKKEKELKAQEQREKAEKKEQQMKEKAAKEQKSNENDAKENNGGKGIYYLNRRSPPEGNGS